jgi:RNA polymerase sigma factor (sigma-70 family)
MRTRSIVAAFSTFLQFDGDRFQQWIADRRLQRSMEQRLSQGVTTENYWALYWHRVWQQSNTGLARSHLIAYLQEPCYWVAQKTAANFVSTQYNLADCFQMAIAQSDKLFKNFDSQQGFNFKTYASATLNSLIRETLRQRQEVDICTDWGLLRKVSQKRLTEALQQAGLATSAVTNHLLAWNCFKLVYVPKQASATRRLPKPEPETWAAIARLYHQENLSDPVKPEQMEKFLSTCAKAARAYLYPNVVSINMPKPGQETGEFVDDLVESGQHDSLLSALMAEEESQVRQQQRQELGTVLRAAIARLDEPSQALVRFYYGDKLTQQEMAERLDMKQYTVSRRLTKARESLLMELAKWSQETLHISPNTDLIKHTSAALEEWLETCFNSPPTP